MLVFDAIYEARTDEEAIDYARGMVWSEVTSTEQDIAYMNYVDTVDGVDVYYDYGADYYFFVDATEEWDTDCDWTDLYVEH